MRHWGRKSIIIKSDLKTCFCQEFWLWRWVEKIASQSNWILNVLVPYLIPALGMKNYGKISFQRFVYLHVCVLSRSGMPDPIHFLPKICISIRRASFLGKNLIIILWANYHILIIHLICISMNIAVHFMYWNHTTPTIY